MTNTGLAYTINRDGGAYQPQKRSWSWWDELLDEINTPEFWLDDVR